MFAEGRRPRRRTSASVGNEGVAVRLRRVSLTSSDRSRRSTLCPSAVDTEGPGPIAERELRRWALSDEASPDADRWRPRQRLGGSTSEALIICDSSPSPRYLVLDGERHAVGRGLARPDARRPPPLAERPRGMRWTTARARRRSARAPLPRPRRASMSQSAIGATPRAERRRRSAIDAGGDQRAHQRRCWHHLDVWPLAIRQLEDRRGPTSRIGGAIELVTVLAEPLHGRPPDTRMPSPTRDPVLSPDDADRARPAGWREDRAVGAKPRLVERMRERISMTSVRAMSALASSSHNRDWLCTASELPSGWTSVDPSRTASSRSHCGSGVDLRARTPIPTSHGASSVALRGREAAPAAASPMRGSTPRSGSAAESRS